MSDEQTAGAVASDAVERLAALLNRARQAGQGEYVGAVLDDEDLRAIHAVLDRITIAERNAQTAARENEQARLLLEAERESMAEYDRRLAAADRDLLEAERIGLEATMEHNTAQSRVTALEAALRAYYAEHYVVDMTRSCTPCAVARALLAEGAEEANIANTEGGG